MSETTQTGKPVIDCETCGRRHPAARKHCTGCGRATLFINARTGQCITCEGWDVR